MTTTRKAPRPESVKIGQVEYTIEFTDPKVLEASSDLKIADCNEEAAHIRVSFALPDSVQRASLFHEILHAIANVYGGHRSSMLNLYVKRGKRNTTLVEEMFVSFFEPGILQFIADNPKVWAWIQGI